MEKPSVNVEANDGRLAVTLCYLGSHSHEYSETRIWWNHSAREWYGRHYSFWKPGKDWDWNESSEWIDLQPEHLGALLEAYGIASAEIDPEQVRHMEPDALMSLRMDHLRRQAYSLWELRGRPFGDSLQDWKAAERNAGGYMHSLRLRGLRSHSDWQLAEAEEQAYFDTLRPAKSR